MEFRVFLFEIGFKVQNRKLFPPIVQDYYGIFLFFHSVQQ